jgi:hypothetical protein
MSSRTPCAILMTYQDDNWHKVIVCGTAAAAAQRWLAGIEARPRSKEGASGKPLAWLYLGSADEPGATRFTATRSIGLQTDVLIALDRSLTAEDFQELEEIFDRDGQPFTGAVEAS